MNLQEVTSHLEALVRSEDDVRLTWWLDNSHQSHTTEKMTAAEALVQVGALYTNAANGNRTVDFTVRSVTGQFRPACPSCARQLPGAPEPWCQRKDLHNAA
jgi:hypothetical protein